MRHLILSVLISLGQEISENGMFGLNHYTVEISGDVTEAGRQTKKDRAFDFEKLSLAICILTFIMIDVILGGFIVEAFNQNIYLSASVMKHVKVYFLSFHHPEPSNNTWNSGMCRSQTNGRG